MNYPFSGIIVRYLYADDAAQSSAPSIAAENLSHAPENQSQVPSGESLEQADIKNAGDQLHVNLWHLAVRNYLDIGVMVSSPKDVREIWLDFPWKVTPESLSDLGSMLDGEKMITAIFNELVSYDGKSESEYAKVTLELNSGAKSTFLVVRLGRPYFKFEYRPGPGESTRVKITWPTALKGPSPDFRLPRYIRLRISDVPSEVFFSTFRPKDRNLLSSSSVTRLFDFRVNVRRGIPDEVLLGEPQLQFPKCERIHLFVIVDREIELVFQSGSFKGCRSLEDEGIWNYYLGLSKRKSRPLETVRDYLGYQWSVAKKGAENTEPAKDLVALGRFVRTRSSRWNNGRFILIVILLGACGSALWDLLKADFSSTVVIDGTLTIGQMGERLAIMLVIVFVLLLSDRETVHDFLKVGKRGIIWVLQTIRNKWKRLG